MTQLINLSIVEVFLLGYIQYLLPIGSCQEFALAVKQLQCIPLAGVMRSSNDNTTIGPAHANGQLRGRRRGITDVNDIKTHANQCAANHVTNHRTGNATIATNHNLTRLAGNEGGIGRRKLYNIQRIKGVTRSSANSSTDARNRFNQCHIIISLFRKKFRNNKDTRLP